MLTKIFVNLACVFSTVLLGYTAVSGDTSYLSPLTVYFSIVLTAGTVVLPLIFSAITFAPESTDTSKLVESLGKRVKGYTAQFLVFSKVISTIALLAITGYTTILVWYFIVSFCTVKLLFVCKGKLEE